MLHNIFGMAHGMMATIHSYTGDQNLLDGPHKDPRRGGTGEPRLRRRGGEGRRTCVRTRKKPWICGFRASSLSVTADW